MREKLVPMESSKVTPRAWDPCLMLHKSPAIFQGRKAVGTGAVVLHMSLLVGCSVKAASAQGESLWCRQRLESGCVLWEPWSQT